MTQAYKRVTIIKLKSGEEIQVTVEEGDKIRAAKAKGVGSVFLKSHDKRMIDVVMIGDIQDKTVEDPQQMIAETRESRLLGQSIPKPATDNSPGYLKFLKAREKLLKKLRSHH